MGPARHEEELMDYRSEVLRNCPGFELDLIDKKLSLAALGIAGEAGEVLEVFGDPDAQYFGLGCPPEIGLKIVKEMGDVYWYLEYLGATMRVTREQCLAAIDDMPWPELYRRNVAAGISINACAIADVIKKVLHHQVRLGDRHNELVRRMGSVYHGLALMGSSVGVTPEQVMQVNVEKLRARHPNGWTPASQQAKADEQAIR
jgi:hypothetical protein